MRYLLYFTRLLILLFSSLVWTGSSLAQDTQVKFDGVVVAAQSWDVAPKIDARIRDLHFIEGQLVSQGDLIVELNDTQAAIKVGLAQNALLRANILLKEEQSDYARQKKLTDKNVSSPSALSDAGLSEELAEAGVSSAELALEAARDNLAAHKLFAPSTGMISAPRFRVGSNFNVFAGSIATIVQLDPINVRAKMSLEDVLVELLDGTFTVEATKELIIDLALPNGTPYPFQGKIVSLGFELDPETGVGSVLVEFPNPRHILRPGLPVIASVSQY